MEIIADRQVCSGCTACKIKCPQKAIFMKEDKKGFVYPVIDQSICIDCGLCKRICPAINNVRKHAPERIVSVKLKDTNKIVRSQSGGAFTVIAEYFISQGAIIYGCAMDNQNEVRYSRVTSIHELERLKGSKYVQAALDNTYEMVKEDLNKGHLILFSGTPCYIAGLNNALKNERHYSRLFTVDLICHGTPSPKIYRDYLHWVETQYGTSIKQFDFRARSLPWRTYKEYIKLKNGKELYSQMYASFFNSNLTLRSSCSVCQYTNLERVSDFTIGDYWGIENEFPEFEDSRGVSLLFLNTDRSKMIFQKIQRNVHFIDIKPEQCMQPNLIAPTYVSKKMENMFWKIYRKNGMNKSYKNFFKLSEYFTRIERKFKRLIFNQE